MGTNYREANERFEKKKREEVLKDIPAKFHDKANQILDYEEEEAYFQAEQLCLDILNDPDGKGNEQVMVMLARVYPKLLRTDIEESNQRYQEDLQKYYAFLDRVVMNDLMQEYLIETLARLWELMGNKWFRPLLKEFVDHIKEKDYLKDEVYKRTLESAYASMESYQYFEDSKVSLLMKQALKAAYDMSYVMTEAKTEETANTMKIDGLMHQWYICKYYDTHQEEFSYIEKNYPSSYSLVAKVVSLAKENASKKQDTILEELMNHVVEGTKKEQLLKVLETSYADLSSKTEKQPEVVHKGKTSYIRPTDKIGRNDPCPCGSGKKYKFCCGRE